MSVERLSNAGSGDDDAGDDAASIESHYLSGEEAGAESSQFFDCSTCVLRQLLTS